VLLAIETSCDETAVALLDQTAYLAGNHLYNSVVIAELVSSQVKFHQPYGGVVPELASREHILNLPLLVKELLQRYNLPAEQIEGIAVTAGPGLKGCLLVGLAFAKGLAQKLNVPLFAINHLEGHLLSAHLEPARPGYPYLALLVSGGNTLLALVRGVRNYRILASTRDDAAGEAFDKIATLLNLPYPGGPELSARAALGNAASFQLPVGVPSESDAFSFSGLKTAVARLVQQCTKNGTLQLSESTRCDIAATSQEAIVQALVIKTSENLRAIMREEPQVKQLVLCGGVAANSRLRARIAEVLAPLGVQLIVPPLKLCTDNAVMIGVVSLELLQSGLADLGSGFVDEQVSALPRWPLGEL